MIVHYRLLNRSVSLADKLPAMASRAEQKAAARARREAQQRASSVAQARRTRLIWLGGVVAAVAVVIVVIVVAVGGGTKTLTIKQAQAKVTSLLHGIPQSGNTLGNPSAPITLTEYGDLVCPICQEFALTTEQNLISGPVRAGKVKIKYLAAETASGNANAGEFIPSQVAALAAGNQHLAWNYIMLWYYEQQSEDTAYVTENFIQRLAQHVPGLDLTKWQADRDDQSLVNQVKSDLSSMEGLVKNKAVTEYATPTLIFSNDKSGQASAPFQGVPTFGSMQTIIKELA